MVLVPTLIFFLMLFWMGAIAVNQPQAVVAARYDAWEKRSGEAAKPFELTDYNQGLVEGSAERPINVTHRLNDLIIPKSSHSIFAGAWQQPHIDLNRSPNWDLYGKLAEKAGAGKLNEVSDLQNQFSNLGSQAGDVIRDQIDGVSRDLLASRGKLEQAQQDAERKLEKVA